MAATLSRRGALALGPRGWARWGAWWVCVRPLCGCCGPLARKWPARPLLWKASDVQLHAPPLNVQASPVDWARRDGDFDRGLADGGTADGGGVATGGPQQIPGQHPGRAARRRHGGRVGARRTVQGERRGRCAARRTGGRQRRRLGRRAAGHGDQGEQNRLEGRFGSSFRQVLGEQPGTTQGHFLQSETRGG